MPSTLLLFVEDGLCKLCLSDRDNDMVCFRGARTFLEALEGLERALQAGEAEWRQKRAYTPKRG